jgi:hypothetical protein
VTCPCPHLPTLSITHHRTIYHQAEFSKQAEEAAKTRARQEAEALAALERGEDVAVGPNGKPLLMPDGTPMRKGQNPRDGPFSRGDAASGISPESLEEEELARLRAGGKPRPGGAGAAKADKYLSPEQKAAKRRADELKWLEEFSTKEAKRQQALQTNGFAGEKAAGTTASTASSAVASGGVARASGGGGDCGESSGGKLLTRMEWEAAEAKRREACDAKEAAEAEARRAAAAKEVAAMRLASAAESTASTGGRKAEGGFSRASVAEAAAAALGPAAGVVSEAGSAMDKKRKTKAKQLKKKDKSSQRDDIRRLAQSASALSF